MAGMHEISRSVVKKDHAMKMSGRSIYVADEPSDGVLCGKLLRSERARARVLGVTVPPLPEGYWYVDAKDVPGENVVEIHLLDTPVFCRDTVEYVGEPIAMICGPDEAEVVRLRDACEVRYEELEPVLDLRAAQEAFFELEFGHGDVERAFAEADHVFEEEFETGYQEQAYLETQGMMAEPEEGGRMFVHGSSQCVYYVRDAVKRALGRGDDGVRALQRPTGGGFGGKEAYPSIVGCQVAVAAHKCGKPVRCVFDRREDMAYTSKRHPSLSRYKIAVKDGRVTAMDIDVVYDAGAYSTLSGIVLKRGVVSSAGAYVVPALHVHGRALKTNTVPCGAYRGFGAPQTFFAVEMMMGHVARRIGVEPLTFKEAHLARQGDPTSTLGKWHEPVPLPAMIEQIDRACEFRKKRAEYSGPQTGRYRRGIGMSMWSHGTGFFGSGERDLVRPVARLHKYPDGRVECLASNGEIGQGVRTTFPKIVAHELDIPLDRVWYDHPDTSRVPDSGPTVASRSLMIVGELLRRAAIELREQWIDGEDQLIEARYEPPKDAIPFDEATFTGDAYPAYAWGIHAIELEIDTYTGVADVLGAYGSFDVGTPIDHDVVMGQMEGGFLQGIGYAAMEKMARGADGRIRDASFSDYLIPTAKDVPKLECMLHVEEHRYGPYGAKGAGEPPLVGAPAAWLEAVEQALGGVMLHHVPFTAEDVVAAIVKEGI